MAFITQFLDMLKSTITHERVTGRDDYGKPTYSPAASYRARVDYTTRVVPNKQGLDTLSTCTIWMVGTPDIAIEDRFTLPDGSHPAIVNWDQPTDETGAKTHTKVYFG